MEKKTVAFLTISLGYGGAERVISRLAPEMSKYYNFYIILFDSTKNVYNCQSEIISLGENEIGNRFLYAVDLIKKGRKLRKIVTEKNIDCVVSFLPIPDIINILFNKKSKRVINIRGDLNQDLIGNKFSSKVKHWLKTKLYKKVDGAIVLSKITKSQLINEYGIKRNISVTANPFDTSDIFSMSRQKIDADDETYFSGNTIISVGRLNYLKGFDHLIRVVKLLVDRGCNIRLIIVGEGEEREKLEKMIDDFSLENHVVLPGKRENPFKYVSRASIYITSSISEGFPNAMVEAMACQVPVISTDCKTGPREILYEECNINDTASSLEYADYGILVPCFKDVTDESVNNDNYNIMADAIEKLINDKVLYEKYKSKSKERAENYSFEKCVEAYEKYIDGIIN